jgi:hypothetical protein
MSLSSRFAGAAAAGAAGAAAAEAGPPGPLGFSAPPGPLEPPGVLHRAVCRCPAVLCEAMVVVCVVVGVISAGGVLGLTVVVAAVAVVV